MRIEFKINCQFFKTGMHVANEQLCRIAYLCGFSEELAII